MYMSSLCLGWIADGNGAYYYARTGSNVPGIVQYHAGLWYECTKQFGDTLQCTNLNAHVGGSNGVSSQMAAARAFTIIETCLAFFTMVAMIVVLCRLRYGDTYKHAPGYRFVSALVSFTFIIAVIAFFVGMGAMDYYDDSETRHNIGWSWALQFVGLIVTPISLLLFSVALYRNSKYSPAGYGSRFA